MEKINKNKDEKSPRNVEYKKNGLVKKWMSVLRIYESRSISDIGISDLISKFSNITIGVPSKNEKIHNIANIRGNEMGKNWVSLKLFFLLLAVLKESIIIKITNELRSKKI